MGLALLACVAVFFLAIEEAEPLLTVRTPVEAADVIVVLGGDGPRRAWRAAEIYRTGVAPRVLVTGAGDCAGIRDLMVQAGVPAGSIELECASHTTWENAVFSTPLLAAMDARRAILVTSWFHTRRALATFALVMPQIDWMSAPVEPSGSIWQILGGDDGPAVAKEYAKIGWYSVRYGIAIL
jgi:uncharacterized SAM-binding protein YcdF (DUF218 family)